MTNTNEGGKNMTKNLVKLGIVGIVLAMIVCIPVSANVLVSNGGTVISDDNIRYDFDFITPECSIYGIWYENWMTMAPMHTVDLSYPYDVVFRVSEFTGYTGLWRCVDKKTGVANPTGPTFKMKAPLISVTDLPTPLPTPTFGDIIISSEPSEATVYVDNVIKGITPMTVSDISNGDHTVKVKLTGYDDYQTGIFVNSSDVTLSINLVAIPTQEQTMEEETIEPTLVVETPNYSETIAAIQSQVSQQAEQINVHSTQIESQATQINQQATAIATQAAVNQQQEEDISFMQQIINTILAFLGIS